MNKNYSTLAGYDEMLITSTWNEVYIFGYSAYTIRLLFTIQDVHKGIVGPNIDLIYGIWAYDGVIYSCSNDTTVTSITLN